MSVTGHRPRQRPDDFGFERFANEHLGGIKVQPLAAPPPAATTKPRRSIVIEKMPVDIMSASTRLTTGEPHRSTHYESEVPVSNSENKTSGTEIARNIAIVLCGIGSVLWVIAQFFSMPQNRADVQLAFLGVEKARYEAEKAKHTAANAPPVLYQQAPVRELGGLVKSHLAVKGETFIVTGAGNTLFADAPTSISGSEYRLSLKSDPSTFVHSSQGWPAVQAFLEQAVNNKEWVNIYTRNATINM